MTARATRRPPVELAGRVVLVTGASGGIGAATCAALTRRGAVVVAAGRDETALAAVAAASTVVADAADPAAAPALVATAVDRHGRLDAVVANAGIGWAGEFAGMDPARITELVDVNLRAPMLLARAALPVLRRPGALVFLTSIAGLVGVPGETVYSVTKAGLETFATLLREELDGITVSTVAPGAVDTAFFTNRGVPYDRSFPRPIPPGQVAEAVVEAIATGRQRRVEPRWLAVPARLSATVPKTYRALARRFG
ncbi:MAG TPA: SDR family oxidoreductase [Mycobacteriales bacterium]|nr:SDR family oxidoreductase [Mycobacteriales bacterium]